MKWSIFRSVSKALAAACVMASVLIAPSAPAAFDSTTQPPPGDLQVLRITPEGADVPAGVIRST